MPPAKRRSARSAKGRPVRTEKIARKPGRRKRDCANGRFVALAVRANNCNEKTPAQLGRWWEATPGERGDGLRYPTRGMMLRALVARNRDLIDTYGGLNVAMTGGELDAVNELHGLKGAKRVTTIAQAIEACTPKGRPWALDRVDMETLNATAPALEYAEEHGDGFVLPDRAAEESLLRRHAARWEADETRGREWNREPTAWEKLADFVTAPEDVPF